MQASTKRPGKARKQAAAKLPYPELPDSDSKLFWLAAYQRDDAELDALKQLTNCRAFIKRSTIARMAIIGAVGLQQSARNASLHRAIEDGSLLFAHPATTVFADVGMSA